MSDIYSAQYRDKFTCPNCGSNDTRRIKYASPEQATWECHICSWAFVVREPRQMEIARNGEHEVRE